MELEYTDFLKKKTIKYTASGFKTGNPINSILFDFQRDIVNWALNKGRAAVFAGTGLGKTLIQVEWADHVNVYTNKNILIIAPLAVAEQTIREAKKLNIEVHLCRSQDDIKSGINITNYEMLNHFNTDLGGIVLDESSILKAFTGKIRNEIISKFSDVPYKLACTATPSPNDYMELGNHSEFLNIMSRTEMLATYFVHDGGETSKWRLKRHAEKDFWVWVSSWAVMLRHPSDLGYDGGMFDLPELRIHEVIVDKSKYAVKMAKTLSDRRRARKGSMGKRIEYAAQIANENDDKCLVWCDLNDESKLLSNSILDAVEVKGSDSPEHKAGSMLGFADGDIRCLVTKPSICGFGMNFQVSHKMIFVGISDSFEQYYQAVRRCWRFGQTEPVDVYIITSQKEGNVVKNIKRKEKQFEKMLKGMISATQELSKSNLHEYANTEDEYKPTVINNDLWTMYNGDCVEQTQALDDNSIHYTIFSPPFASLYTYSNSKRDMGNSRTKEEFDTHFNYLVSQLYRILKPGRLTSVHCMNLPSMKERDGVIGIKDFRGDIIRMFQEVGFIYHSEVCIWKDPVVSMQRTKALGLLHKQLKKDSCMSRMGIPDYVVTFRKPGDNPEPVSHTDRSFPVSIWQRYASPIWTDINPSDTLQKESAREHEDEKHIAPLQLEVIRRCLELWTNEGDLVFSPFAGIGSEGYEAVKMGRRFVGVELKKSYFDQAVGNLKAAERELEKPKQVMLEPFIEKTRLGDFG